MATSRPANTSPETAPSTWSNFKAWTLSTVTTKPGRWMLSFAQSGGSGVFVYSMLNIVFPENVFFDIVKYTLSALTIGGLTRYNSHDMSARLEKDTMETLRREVLELKIANLENIYNSNILIANNNIDILLKSLLGQPIPLGHDINTLSILDFNTDPRIAAKNIEIEETVAKNAAANGNSCLRIRRLLLKNSDAENQIAKQKSPVSSSSSEKRGLNSANVKRYDSTNSTDMAAASYLTIDTAVSLDDAQANINTDDYKFQRDPLNSLTPSPQVSPISPLTNSRHSFLSSPPFLPTTSRPGLPSSSHLLSTTDSGMFLNDDALQEHTYGYTGLAF